MIYDANVLMLCVYSVYIRLFTVPSAILYYAILNTMPDINSLTYFSSTFLYPYLGQIPHGCIQNVYSTADPAKQAEIYSWSRLFYAETKGQLGYVTGNLYHTWHGDLDTRQYYQRIQDFNTIEKKVTTGPNGATAQPHVKDANGLYVSKVPELNKYVGEYFDHRDGNGVPVKPVVAVNKGGSVATTASPSNTPTTAPRLGNQPGKPNQSPVFSVPSRNQPPTYRTVGGGDFDGGGLDDVNTPSTIGGGGGGFYYNDPTDDISVAVAEVVDDAGGAADNGITYVTSAGGYYD